MEKLDIEFVRPQFPAFSEKSLFKKAALGKGDSFLAACLGSWLGFKGLLLSTLLSFYYAGVFVCIGIAIKKLKLGEIKYM